LVDVVVDVVDIDGGHLNSPFIKKPHPLVRGGVLKMLPTLLAGAVGISNSSET
jgi:hypothetical protein